MATYTVQRAGHFSFPTAIQSQQVRAACDACPALGHAVGRHCGGSDAPGYRSGSTRPRRSVCRCRMLSTASTVGTPFRRRAGARGGALRRQPIRAAAHADTRCDGLSCSVLTIPNVRTGRASVGRAPASAMPAPRTMVGTKPRRAPRTPPTSAPTPSAPQLATVTLYGGSAALKRGRYKPTSSAGAPSRPSGTNR
jgi:hypothetical protein